MDILIKDYSIKERASTANSNKKEWIKQETVNFLTSTLDKIVLGIVSEYPFEEHIRLDFLETVDPIQGKTFDFYSLRVSNCDTQNLLFSRISDVSNEDFPPLVLRYAAKVAYQAGYEDNVEQCEDEHAVASFVVKLH